MASAALIENASAVARFAPSMCRVVALLPK